MIYDLNKRRKGSNSPRLSRKLILGIILILAIIAAAVTMGIYLQVIQLDEIGGFSSVFWTNIKIMLVSIAIVFILVLILFLITNRVIDKNIDTFYKETEIEKIHIPNTLVAVAVAAIAAFITKDMFYEKALMFFNSVDFGSVDPIFSQDIGYYILRRPFLMSIYDFFSGLMLFTAIYSAAYYLIISTMVYGVTTIDSLKKKSILIHNIINIALFFIVKALSYKFSMENILYGSIKNTKGASYVDVTIWKTFYQIAPFIMFAIIALTLFFILRGRLKNAVYSILLYPLIFILVSLSATVVQKLVVDPNEFMMEKTFINYSIQKTREAYNLDSITEEMFGATQNLTLETLNANPDTVSNIRVVDYRATLRSNNQLQSIRTFFSFHDGDIINYNINGKHTPVFISAREIDKERIPEKTYVNSMFKYTHGYGVVINPINTYTSSGQVDYVLKDIELNSIDPNLNITQPRIYYGEQTNDYVIVGANGIDEIDRDVDDQVRYDGKGGIKLGLLNKLLFAINKQDANMAISGYIKDESRLLINRNVVERARMAAPFLAVDDDPYIILTPEGQLKWVLDGYTTSDKFPYSQSISGINYIRNSVKIVIDAYNGDVSFYIIDDEDPIIKTYQNIYPEVFSENELPDFVKQHMKYPETLYKIQSEILKRYHFDTVKNENSIEAFYNNQDIWEIAKYTDMQEDGKVREMEPYYNMIKLPRGLGESAELVVMSPYTPLAKDNMVAWLAARNSFDNYGELILFTFPKQRQIYGPNQVESQINQHPEISQHMTLWGKEGSRVFKGNLLAIPIEESILYIEPIYTESTNNVSIPQVKEVVLGYQTGENMNIAYGATLAEAITRLFNGRVEAVTPTKPTDDGATTGDGTTTDSTGQGTQTLGTVEDRVKRVDDVFAEIKKSFNTGDWESFGKNMKELEQAIDQLVD